MKPRRLQPAMPSAVMAAVVVLSLSSVAEMTLAAVVLNAGRSLPISAAGRPLTDGQSLGQWLTRLTDAAREVRSRVGGQTHDVKPAAVTLGRATFTCTEAADAQRPHRPVLDFLAVPSPAPVRACLTDLPPPRR